jgi:hypothetical protein
MPFNSGKFGSAKFVPRTERVKVAALQDWFDEGEAPEFEVRGLTAAELAKSNEATDNSEKIKAILEALTTNNKQKTKSAFTSLFGLGEDTPVEVMKRITMLTMGSVEPELDERTVVKLAENYPIEFYQLTNKITELTGLGSVLEGKSQPSGATPESESLAPSATAETSSSMS